MEVDWLPSGTQTTTIRRGCGSTYKLSQEADTVVCDGRKTAGFRRRHCIKTCSGEAGDDPCNKENDGIASELSAQVVSSCKVCTSESVADDAENDCASDPGKSQSCPEYARASCFAARSRNIEAGSTNGTSIVTHGCSAFTQQVQSCVTYSDATEEETIANIEHQVCKQTCDFDNNCNNEVIGLPEEEPPTFCFVCTGYYNSIGVEIGSATGCYNLEIEENSNKNLRQCSSTSQSCFTQMHVEWKANGEQQMQITRGCSDEEPPSAAKSTEFPVTCEASSDVSGAFLYSDCTQTFPIGKLGASPANKDTEELEKAVSGVGLWNNGLQEPVISCHACEHFSSTDGDSKNSCDEQPGDETIKECPLYAQAGCFVSHTTREVLHGYRSRDTHRGCSTFNLATEGGVADLKPVCNGFKANDEEGQPREFNSCKQTCSTENCNNEEPVTRPETLSCYSCSETWSHLNMTVGSSDQGCFMDPGEEFIVECGPDDHMCAIEFEIDWLLNGQQNTIVRRSCTRGDREAGPGTECSVNSGSSANFHFKKCTETTRGSNSNSHLDILAYFANPTPVIDCYSCSHNSEQGADADNCLASNELLENEDFILKCGSWQAEGCFTGNRF
ncbi:unnamed protein product [Oikopleura dioica]|uniref:Uncharacterized protein n=1 Tax=Oikopleura dioica TaxID=34765 RepID=E4Y7T4_OIKDI|nr:unnamed protein product [Oikopleura dioica]